MELFTLGADRGAYTEDDVRELARSLSGWDYDWSGDARRAQLPLGRAGPLGPGLKTVFGKTGRWTWEDACRHGRRRTRCTRRSSSRSCGATSSRRRRTPATAAKLEALYKGSGYEIRPVLEAILTSQGSSTRGRGWSSRRPCSWPGMLRAPQARDHHERVVVGAAAAPASASTTRRTSRAGTTSAGSTPTRRSGAGRRSSYALEDDTEAPGSDDVPGGDRRPRRWRRRARSGATRRSPRRAVAALNSFASAADPRHRRAVAARAAPERAAAADRRLPRLPDS